MKKFLTYISMQAEEDLKKLHYKIFDNEEMTDGEAAYFPISLLIKNYAEKGDQIAVICIKEQNNSNSEKNIQVLKDEIETIGQENGFKFEMEVIDIPKKENSASHLSTFKSIIDRISDNDNIYACCTYGTKPIPIIEMIALNYVYQVRDNVIIKNIVYGKVIREGREITGAELYDVTPLFHMMQLTNTLARQNVKNPDELIRTVLDIEED